ncbi:MAG: NAD(P)/FAD-dependent oxidoreductase [Oscillospiraceae bacterium]|nr:NAD(P)/FAD-dependent oxidoreductase [Oscillospiraceae bacterium]
MAEFKYPHLFEPIRLGNQLFRNRLFASPTGFQDVDDSGWLPAEAAAYYERKAIGGAASVTSCECIVDTELGLGTPRHFRLDNPMSHYSLARVAHAVSRHGAVASAELQHAGMYANRDLAMFGGGSTGAAYGPVETELNGRRVLPMDEAMIERTIAKYAQAAAAAKSLGFGMVTVHAGHGWMLQQFLSPTLNTRTDKWGGPDIENRARLMVSVCDAIRKAVGPGFPIEVRISGSEVYEGGYGIEEGIAIAKQLDGHCNLIHVSAGSHEVDEVFTVTHPSMFMEDGCNVKYAAEIKKHVTTPVATVGALSDPELMEEIIASGKADVVEMARQLLADPDTPNKLRTGREKEIRRCMRCLSCFSSELTHGAPYCAINPECGRELEIKYDNARPAVSKKVLIAGGGIGGMQAALTCAERGHQVILCEKTDRLGGTLRCESKVPFKPNLDRYLNAQAAAVAANPAIELRLNTAVTPALAEELKPDVIFAATGARPVKPPIPGIDGEHVISAEEAYQAPEKAGNRVVILGAGLVGIELGIFLAMQGRKITILEMAPTMNDGGNFLHASGLRVQIKKYGIDIHCSTKASSITEEGVIGQTEAGDTLFPADTVIYAVGQRSVSEEALALNYCAPEFYMLGDCVSPRNITAATSAAYTLARDLGVR